MRQLSRHFMFALALGFLAVLGCRASDDSQASANGKSGFLGLFGGARVNLPVGASMTVRLDETLSSETARRGDWWQGTVANAVIVDGKEAIPKGAIVEGVVVATEEAQRGSRAKLELGVRAIRVGDHKTSLHASSQPVIAGSPRARNLGAIAGGAAAGAILGEVIDDKPGTGAVVGGVIAGGAVAASKGYQVVLENGTVLKFVVNENVAVRVG
jgi:hypothetical protein